ncbi:MAG: hypothetical protein WCI77_05680 [Candidatus Omnitrophota bacterium]
MKQRVAISYHAPVIITSLFLISTSLFLFCIFIPISYATDTSGIARIPVKRDSGGTAKNASATGQAVPTPNANQNNPTQRVASHSEVLAPGAQALGAYKEGALGNNIGSLQQERTNLLWSRYVNPGSPANAFQDAGGGVTGQNAQTGFTIWQQGHGVAQMELGDGTIIKDNQAFRAGQQIDTHQFLKGAAYGDVTIKRMTFTNGQTIDGYTTPGQELLFYLDTQAGPQAAVIVPEAARKPAAEAAPQRPAVDTAKETPKTGTPSAGAPTTGVPATGAPTTPIPPVTKPAPDTGTKINLPTGQEPGTAKLATTAGTDKNPPEEPKLGGFRSNPKSGAEMLGLVPKTLPTIAEVIAPPKLAATTQAGTVQIEEQVDIQKIAAPETPAAAPVKPPEPQKLSLADRQYMKDEIIKKFIEDRGFWRFLGPGKYWEKGHTITLHGITYEIKAANHQFGAYSAYYRPVGSKDWIYANTRDE